MYIDVMCYRNSRIECFCGSAAIVCGEIDDGAG